MDPDQPKPNVIRHRLPYTLVMIALFAFGAAALWSLFRTMHENPYIAAGGREVRDFGFDLSTNRIPIENIVAAASKKDFIPALSDPRILTPKQAEHMKNLEAVIGVELNGHARAYPIHILNWHEVVNDTLGDRPIAVTYCPLSDSAIVFDRRIDGRIAEFGVSGLLYNSNTLMYEKRPDDKNEGLWSQLMMKAVTGPSAERGETLTPIACALTDWRDWQARHPDTTVIARHPSRQKMYKRSPYTSYYGSDRLMFPAEPLPPGERDKKTRLLILRIDGRDYLYSYPYIKSRIGADQRWATTVADRAVIFIYDPHTETARAEWVPGGHEITSFYSFWFAWYAMHPHQAITLNGTTQPAS